MVKKTYTKKRVSRKVTPLRRVNKVSSTYKQNIKHLQNKYAMIAKAKQNSLDNLTREDRMLWKLENGCIDLELGTLEEYTKLQEQLEVQRYLESLKENPVSLDDAPTAEPA